MQPDPLLIRRLTLTNKHIYDKPQLNTRTKYQQYADAEPRPAESEIVTAAKHAFTLERLHELPMGAVYLVRVAHHLEAAQLAQLKALLEAVSKTINGRFVIWDDDAVEFCNEPSVQELLRPLVETEVARQLSGVRLMQTDKPRRPSRGTL
jgi:hypothetical protein